MSMRTFVATLVAVVIGAAAAYYVPLWWSSSGSHSGVPVTLRLVNVLTEKEFEDAHIAPTNGVASIHVPLTELSKQADSWDKEVPIVTYCSNYMCTASGEAAKRLREMGFQDVRAYEAGMAEWYQLSKKDSSYGVAGPAQQKYLTYNVPKPKQKDDSVPTITSQELKELIKKARLKAEEIAARAA